MDGHIPERRGQRWSLEEYEKLVAGIVEGLTAEELAARHQRSVASIGWAARSLVPAEEAVDGATALARLTERLTGGGADGTYDSRADGTYDSAYEGRPDGTYNATYDWRARLADVLRTRAATRKTREARGRRERPRQCEPDTIAALWQEATAHRLSPERRTEFLARQPVKALTTYTEDALRPVAARLWRAHGRLLLEEWLLEAKCPGHTAADLSWEAVAEGDTDATTVLHDLSAAAVDELRDVRAHAVLCRRLGLDGHDPRTQSAIGREFSLTRQRVSQLQARGFVRILGSRDPATVALREALRLLLHDGAPGEGAPGEAESAERLRAVADVSFPGAPLNPAGLLLARLSGKSDDEAKRLLGVISALDSQRRKEERQRHHLEARAARASARWTDLAAAADWSGTPGPAPAPEELSALRDVNPREHSGSWFSTKLGREVQYESTTELQVLQLLDHARQIAYYQEQPLAIGYTYRGRPRTYYPDFLAVTTRGHAVLIEAKPQYAIPLAINEAKYRAAAGYCAGRGWGLLVTDGSRTRAGLARHTVDSELERRLLAAVTERELTWPDIREIGHGIPFTSLDIAALVLRHRWTWELGPYRLRST
ncbi:TnsA endonuclease N-terminal domain-containing protein [Streptomyces sp. NPDC001678]|uniref:TnsA endonuclease N-terminal domain-containing protein n=1 Tax=Streptomyces sp. NPDC001678 TaxID=3364599 RepID=UPI0036A789D9